MWGPVRVAVMVVVLLATTCHGNTAVGERDERPTLGHLDERATVAHPDAPFNVLTLFKTPSNLASLISKAMRKEEGEEKEEEEEEMQRFTNTTSEISGNATVDKADVVSSTFPHSPSSLASLIASITSSLASASASSSSSTPGSDVQFSPASSTQFGDPGTGSKLVDLFSEMTQYSVSATEVAPLAGAGAVALLALGALFAVPVAPVILRRTGVAGWSGLPSLSEMWGWFRAEDPVAEAWVDSYNQGLEVGGGQYGSYQQKEHYNNYDHSISGSQPEQYFEGAHANPRPSHHYPRPAEPLPPHRYQEGSSRYPHNAAPHKRRQGNRRVSENGYEYVNLDEINRIGDASVRLFAQIVQGMDENHQHPEDFYRYPDEDNTIARRRLSAPRPHPNPYPAQTHPYQYPEEPSYQAYPQEQYQEESYKFPYQSEGNSEGYSPEEHHWYTGQGNDASFKDTKEDSYKDVPHPYRKEGEEVYLTDLQGGSSKQSASQSPGQPQSPSQSAQHAVKISDFPYEFHKGD